MKIINKYYNLNKINKKIVLISDLHYYDKNDIKLFDRVLNRIYSINPDYICIPGDITDISNAYDEDYFIDWLKRLSSKYKTIITLGNHEYYIDKSKRNFGLNIKLLKKIENIYNVYLLRQDSIMLDNINFIGLDLGIDYYFNENKCEIDINKYIKKDYNNVLLCHSPVDINNILGKCDIDLVLCGHMHGGVVPRILRPLFKTKGIISPTKKLFPKYAYGLKKVNNTSVITSSGIRIISHVNKFYFLKDLFSAEIVIIDA